MSTIEFLLADYYVREGGLRSAVRSVQSGARIMVAIIFLLNGFGIIDQAAAARELAQAGTPDWAVAPMMLAGRITQVIAGLALAFGVYPRLAAAALVAFIVPATLAAHAFWGDIGTPRFVPQLVQFTKNLAMTGGLLFIAADAAQPVLFRQHSRRAR
jgi:putative oxidoreductase